MNPSVLPLPRRGHLEPVTPHFVVVPVVIVPELLPADTVLNCELQCASAVEVGGRDDLEAELVGDTVAGAGDVGRQTVHECYPVVQRIAQVDALLEGQIQHAHEPGEAELVRLHALQHDFHLPHFLLEARECSRVGELQLHEHGLRWAPGEFGLHVIGVQGSFGEFGQYALRHLRLIRVIEVLHRDELQTQGVGEPDLFLAGRTPAAGDLQLCSLRGRGQRLAPPTQAGTLWRLQEDLPAPRSLVHDGGLNGLAGSVHYFQIVPILEPRVCRCQAPEQSSDAAVVPGQAVLWRQHDHDSVRRLRFHKTQQIPHCRAEVVVMGKTGACPEMEPSGVRDPPRG